MTLESGLDTHGRTNELLDGVPKLCSSWPVSVERGRPIGKTGVFVIVAVAIAGCVAGPHNDTPPSRSAQPPKETRTPSDAEGNQNEISNIQPEDAPPTDRALVALIEDGGQWETWRVPSDGFVARPESFMLAPNGMFGWHEAGALIDPTSPAMIGEGYFRMGKWRLAGQTLVVTEDWARLDNGEERNVDPPIVRQLALAACSRSQRDKLGIPAETACVTIDGKPFLRAGDARMAESELKYALDPLGEDL